ncbi:uncharacterized protein PgNI_04463 [Pyricularia grisea]|uniref:C2H2-type domain-containing protein n=1 Tax=Pyricularia grisea TaxID=148305 RepID=A0A6P8BAH3_PYRGI|nr:uncharacterized protein PgNI_04463 [Pyricularia grisea]TLD12804.1 hypothetical protein PgNI_04463 [Pyricularia grisea]
MSQHLNSRGQTSLAGVLRLKGTIHTKEAVYCSGKPSPQFAIAASETSRSSTPVTDASTYKTSSSVSSWGTGSASQERDVEDCSYPESCKKEFRDNKWDEESAPVRSRRQSSERPTYPVALRPLHSGRDRKSESDSGQAMGGWASLPPSSRGARAALGSEASEDESCMADEEDQYTDEWSGEDDSFDAAIIAAVDGDLALAAYLIPLLHHSFSSAVRSKVEMWQCGTSPESGPQHSDGLRPGSSASANLSPTTPRKRRRRASSGGGGAGDGDGDDDDDEREFGNTNGNPESPSSPLLACPFHKLNPIKYGIQHNATTATTKNDYYRPCAGPGFKTIQRLKEHLKRKHTVVQCQRCYKIFRGQSREASVKLEEHSRTDEPCQKGDPNLREGISTTQWASLDRQNRKKPQEAHKLEKWFEIWTILFPGKEKPTTPWYDGLPIDSGGPPTRESEEFASIFVNILSHKVRQGDIALQADQNTMERLRNVVQQTFRTWASLRDGPQSDASSSLTGSGHHSSSRVGGSSTHFSAPSGSASRQPTASSFTTISASGHVNPMSQPSPRHQQQQFPMHQLNMQPANGGQQFIAMPIGRQASFSPAMPAHGYGMHVPEDMNCLHLYPVQAQMTPALWTTAPNMQYHFAGAVPAHAFNGGATQQINGTEFFSGDGAENFVPGIDGEFGMQ